jgi:hypothetical protein
MREDKEVFSSSWLVDFCFSKFEVRGSSLEISCSEVSDKELSPGLLIFDEVSNSVCSRFFCKNILGHMTCETAIETMTITFTRTRKDKEIESPTISSPKKGNPFNFDRKYKKLPLSPLISYY